MSSLKRITKELNDLGRYVLWWIENLSLVLLFIFFFFQDEWWIIVWVTADLGSPRGPYGILGPMGQVVLIPSSPFFSFPSGYSIWGREGQRLLLWVVLGGVAYFINPVSMIHPFHSSPRYYCITTVVLTSFGICRESTYLPWEAKLGCALFHFFYHQRPPNLLFCWPSRRWRISLASFHHGSSRLPIRRRCLFPFDPFPNRLPFQASKDLLHH